MTLFNALISYFNNKTRVISLSVMSRVYKTLHFRVMQYALTFIHGSICAANNLAYPVTSKGHSQCITNGTVIQQCYKIMSFKNASWVYNARCIFRIFWKIRCTSDWGKGELAARSTTNLLMNSWKPACRDMDRIRCCK